MKAFRLVDQTTELKIRGHMLKVETSRPRRSSRPRPYFSDLDTASRPRPRFRDHNTATNGFLLTWILELEYIFILTRVNIYSMQ
jgi:hypothetical protein